MIKEIEDQIKVFFDKWGNEVDLSKKGDVLSNYSKNIVYIPLTSDFIRYNVDGVKDYYQNSFDLGLQKHFVVKDTYVDNYGTGYLFSGKSRYFYNGDQSILARYTKL